MRLLQSARLQVPLAVGWLRPVILLPVTALTGLPSDQLEAILAHELAHIRRFDYLVNLVQSVVETLLFLPPGGLVDLGSDSRGARTLLRRLGGRSLRRPA